jgi:hypothetical protein
VGTQNKIFGKIPYLSYMKRIIRITESDLVRIIKKVLKENDDLPPSKPPHNIKEILNQIELYEVYPNIFALVIKDDKLRARVFLRYQEFYESDSDTFRGKGFKWEDYINFYKEKTKKDYFSYHEDFAGYNIPCDTIESCKTKIPDLNIYDMIMFSVVDTIKEIVGSNKYYLIGIDQSNNENPSLIYHEIAHGLWFSDPEYKSLMKSLLDQMDSNIKEQIIDILKGYGYGDNVFEDEIQAYMATGLSTKMQSMDNTEQEVIKFKKVFENYIKNIKLQKIPVDWSTDLDYID